MSRSGFVFSISALLVIIAACFFLLDPQRLSIGGGCQDSSSPYLKETFNDGRRITYCSGGDAFVGGLQSEEFIGNRSILIEYSGYPAQPGLGLYLVASDSGRQKIELPDAGEKWQKHKIAIPEKFAGQTLTVMAQDSSSHPFGWIGLSLVENPKLSSASDFIARVLAVILTISIVLSLILTLLFTKFNERDSIALLLLAFGLYSYLIFFVYVASKKTGLILSLTSVFIALYSIAIIYIKGASNNYARSLKFVAPVAMFTLMILVIGYYPFLEISDDSWQIAANRWLSLPIDNWLPKIFADQIWEGKIQRPMIGDWLSSDRPPLQTGVFLLLYPMMPASGVLYQTVGTMLQCFVILALWLFLSSHGYVKNRVSLIFVVCMSSLGLVHSLFVWPKIISATYLILCFNYLWRENDSRIRGLAIGASAALAMLSHGGAIFALAGIFSVWIAVNLGRIEPKKLITYCMTWGVIFVIIMLPWSFYGKYIDPEAGRLVKWHLAGQIPPSEISVFRALIDAYGNLTLEDWMAGRIDNILKIVSGNIVLDVFDVSIKDFVANVRTQSFFGLFYSMWFFSPVFAMVIWTAGGWQKLPMYLWLLFFTASAGTMIWAVLMFIPGSAVVHQGSFFVWIAFFIWSASVIIQVSRAMYCLLFIINLTLAVVVYILNLTFEINSSLVYLGLITILCVAFVLSLYALESEKVPILSRPD